MKKEKQTISKTLNLAITLIVMFLATVSVHAQNMNAQGTIIDESGDFVIGASVLEKGTTNGTVTDVNGRFSLSVPQGSTLVVSFIGYETQELEASDNMSIMLIDEFWMLDDIVAIGYGTSKRADVTTAISSVSTKDIDQRPIISAAQALQGKAAGVNVSSPSGKPGGEMSIRVRGTTSFNGSNDPLYVVDGVPVDNIKFLSPNDIASMEILKDASSAAIYGSRAANGVILISTKAGQSGDAKITLTTQVGMTKVAKTMEALNTAQYRDLQNEIGMISLPEELTDQTDWFKETYQTGLTQNYQASISQSSEKMKYYISGGYSNERGILETSFYKRYNFRINTENEIRSWLKANVSVSYSDYTSNGGGSMGTGSGRGGVILSVINTPSYAPIMNPDAPEQYYNNFYGISNITNPLENQARTKNNRDKENRILASGDLTFTFMPNLTLKTKYTIDRRNAISTSFLDPISTAWGRNQYGEGYDGRNQNTVQTWDNILNYNIDINKLAIDVMAGSSWTDSDYRNSWINGSHYKDDKIQTLNAANKISWDGTGTGASEWGIMSYFGRLSFNYDSKYMLTANVRADGSSKLHPDYRWGIFPSFSGAWRLSSESFMENLEWLDDMKLRAGWGQTGNQSGIGDYAYLQRYNITRYEWFQEGQEHITPSLSQANLRTSDLKWETTTQTCVGLDVTVLSNRLTLALDYYFKKTTDMLMNVSLPAGAAAASNIARNEGEMENKGFEFSINSRNFVGAFTWDTDFNMSFNRNKLTKLALQKVYYDAKTSEYVNDYVVRNEPGRALGGFYGYISDGVDPETGELMYRDINDDGRVSSSDRTYIGDPNPKFTFGMTNNFSYNGWALSIFLQGSYGNDIFNASRMETEGMYDGKNQSTKVLERWRRPGQITDVPKAGFEMKNSTYFIEDGSYLRVKNLQLSYNFKSEKLRNAGITRLQPYFSASNLLTLTKYSGMDPEVNQWGNSGAVQGIDWGTYPQSRSYVFGVNVEF
ncbi:MAG: TonB-dependent receptor [Bacteroidales bacterium]|nr:TonB-dependent receptor [Bacteroidales bacterium]